MSYPICASCGKILEKDKSPFAARGIIPPLYTGVICNKCGKIECVDCKTDKMDAPCSWCGGDVSPAFEHKVVMAQNIERKNLNLRTRLKRLTRKTICFSKSEKMHELVIGLYINKNEFGINV